MSSHLRLQTSFAPFSAHNTASAYPHCTSPPPAKRQRKMTITQTYRLVHSARGKLSKEAQRGEHDLRLLVGHANLLDSLMLELETAEEEQEQWFNNTVTVAAKEEPKHITFAEVEYPESSDSDEDEDEEEEEEDSDEEFDEASLVEMVPLRSANPKQSPHQPRLPSVEEFGVEDDEEEDDMSDDEDANNAALSLCRTRSRSETHSSHPPELVSDSEDSDDDSPSSPPATTIDYSGAQSNFGLMQQKSNDAEAALFEDGFYIPNHHHHSQQSTMIAAC